MSAIMKRQENVCGSPRLMPACLLAFMQIDDESAVVLACPSACWGSWQPTPKLPFSGGGSRPWSYLPNAKHWPPLSTWKRRLLALPPSVAAEPLCLMCQDTSPPQIKTSTWQTDRTHRTDHRHQPRINESNKTREESSIVNEPSERKEIDGSNPLEFWTAYHT